MIEIYWSDLTKEKQQEILDVLGENGNYDVFPIASIPDPELSLIHISPSRPASCRSATSDRACARCSVRSHSTARSTRPA